MRKLFSSAIVGLALAATPALADHYSLQADRMLHKSQTWDGSLALSEDPDKFESQGSKMLETTQGSWSGQGESLGKYSHRDSYGGTVNGKLDRGYYGKDGRDGTGTE